MFANWQNKCYLEIISGKAFLSSDQLHPRVRDGQVLKVHLDDDDEDDDDDDADDGGDDDDDDQARY